jgi:hypothetical protein
LTTRRPSISTSHSRRSGASRARSWSRSPPYDGSCVPPSENGSGARDGLHNVRQPLRDALEWTRTTTGHKAHKALNLGRSRNMRICRRSVCILWSARTVLHRYGLGVCSHGCSRGPSVRVVGHKMALCRSRPTLRRAGRRVRRSVEACAQIGARTRGPRSGCVLRCMR